MPVIYLEDILEQGGNKYLSVNIAARRARELNAENRLPMLVDNAGKPVTVALDELRSGRIGYEELEQPEEAVNELSFGSIDGVEGEPEELLEELHEEDREAPEEVEERR